MPEHEFIHETPPAQLAGGLYCKTLPNLSVDRETSFDLGRKASGRLIAGSNNELLRKPNERRRSRK